MKRFVLLSFVFLGLGFYELSGGNDFDPTEARAAAVDARVARATERSSTFVAEVSKPVSGTSNESAKIASTTKDAFSTDDNVTRTQLDLVSFEAATTIAPLESEGVETSETPPAAPAESIAEIAQRTALEEEPLSLASLNTPNAAAPSIQFSGSTQVAASTTTTGFTDIRSVKGDLVNMRSGPGTDYNVVDQLPRATKVEVLGSDGGGWVELRRIDTGDTGWIAEFLLTSG